MGGEEDSKSSGSHVQAQNVENMFPTPVKKTTSKNSHPVHHFPVSPGTSRLLDGMRSKSPPPDLTQDHFRPPNSHSEDTTHHLDEPGPSQQRHTLSKRKSQYFDEVFGSKERSNTAKDRVTRYSVVMAELRVNRALDKQQAFLIDFALSLSELYQRPAEYILATIIPTTSILLGNTTEPAYLLTITALPGEIATTKNKRAAAIMQEFLSQTLAIPARRGVIRFEAVKEEDLATNGLTALQEIELLERGTLNSLDTFPPLQRQKKPLFGSLASRPQPPPIINESQSPCKFDGQFDDATESRAVIPYRQKKVSRRASLMALFRK